MLPPQGIIVEDEDTICALGLYLNEQVKFGYMYGIFSNPNPTGMMAQEPNVMEEDTDAIDQGLV